jgi:hypothetical protein
MKFLVVVLCFGLALSAPLNPLLDEEWEQYKKSFNKN